jgi:hypothetical protein
MYSFIFYYLFNFLSDLQQSHNIKIANRSFENAAECRYFGITVTDQNLINGEIKSRLNLGNACYHLVQTLWSSTLLYKNVEIKMYKTITFPSVLYG